MTSTSTSRTFGRMLLAGTFVAAALSGTQCEEGNGNTPTDPTPPTASIVLVGDSASVELGVAVQLDGSGSALGEESTADELSYFWELDSRPIDSALVDESLVLVGDDPALVEFSPDVQGLFGITLQVSDGVLVSDAAHVVIQVGGGNHCPVADAGEDCMAQIGVPVTLDGSGTLDEDLPVEEGDDDDSAAEPSVLGLDYTWHFSLVPAESDLDDSDVFYQGTEHPLFIPDVPGTYILQLRASDGICDSEPDYVTVQATDGNLPPISEAGNSIILTPCSPSEITLDGTASYDPEGQPLSYAWHITGVPNGSQVSDAFVDGRFSSTPSFNADVPGIYTLELVVSDGQSESEPSYVAVQVVPSQPNGAPVAVAGEDVQVDATALCINDPYGPNSCNPCGARTVVLDGSGSFDPDNDRLNYQWDLQSGSADLLGVESQTVEISLPEVPVNPSTPTTLTFEVSLTVFDCQNADDDVITISYTCTPNL